MSELDQEPSGPQDWCVVANVASETSHGTGGDEVQAGLKHFAPGARLWVLPPRYANEDERVEVIGLHRGRGARNVQVIIFRRHLESFRIKAVYSPAVRRAMERTNWNWGRVWCCPETAQPWVDRWNALAAGNPSREFPPYSGRSIFGSDARHCPHQSIVGFSPTTEAGDDKHYEVTTTSARHEGA
ncbi:hypothetical protein ACWCO9_18425 [Streptomyces sp. NPDC001937]